MKTYVVVEVSADIENDYGDVDVSTEVKTRQLSFEELLKDEAFHTQLINAGWVNATASTSIDEEFIGPSVFLFQRYGNAPNVYGYPIDPDNFPKLTDYPHNEYSVAVEIGMTNLKRINPEVHKWLKGRRDRAERQKKQAAAREVAAKKKRDEAAAKRKQMKEAKRLEDALKLLEKSGKKVVDAS